MKELSFAHFHNPVFFAGRNLGDKFQLGSTKAGETKAYRIKTNDDDGVLLRCNGKETVIPSTNIVSYTYLTEAEKKPVETKGKPGPKPKTITAQVNTPHDHVFAGHGAGKTNSA